ncbi:hypothetical protein GGE45_000938 [Rhizobium aethiopicum]|nr:hypothetical protein [Rhizobium aethiopicum]MBB4578624.1 hypothetical protein [Rhizobium aethiopicum]
MSIRFAHEQLLITPRKKSIGNRCCDAEDSALFFDLIVIFLLSF